MDKETVAMKDLNIKIDLELKAFLEQAEAMAKLECMFWGHQWRVFPFSTGPVQMCVRCGEQDATDEKGQPE
jgi:hypothetical protein